MELTGDDIKEINRRYMNRTTVFMRNSLYGIAVTQEQVEAHTKYLLSVYNNIQDEYIREKQREAAM
jgi:hypothetical protein